MLFSKFQKSFSILLTVLFFAVGAFFYRAQADTLTAALTDPNQAFLAAITAGNLQDAARWLTLGANINYRDSQGRTAVILATLANDPTAIKFLATKGANMDIKDNHNETALMHTTDTDQEALAYTLLEYGANRNVGGGPAIQVLQTVDECQSGEYKDNDGNWVTMTRNTIPITAPQISELTSALGTTLEALNVSSLKSAANSNATNVQHAMSEPSTKAPNTPDLIPGVKERSIGA